MADKYNIGLIGLAVMGENLVLNMERNGFSVAVYNRTTQRMTNFIEGGAKGKNIKGCETLEELVDSLEEPRKVMLMVQAGAPVDAVILAILDPLDKELRKALLAAEATLGIDRHCLNYTRAFRAGLLE